MSQNTDLPAPPSSPEAQPSDVVPALVPVFTPPAPGELITSEATRNTYTIGSLIGEGNFGYVFECTDTWENELAVKILKPKGSYEQIRDSAVLEYQKLRHLRHPNITYVYDAFEYRHTFYIVFEKCWQSINQFAQGEKFNGQNWLRTIARHLLQAVHFVHCNDFVHQDIHGGNVFVQVAKDEMKPDEMLFTFMLGDLGIAKLAADMDAQNTVLADWMRAPEAIEPAEFGLMDHRMDMYHCGLLFLQVLMGAPLQFTRDEVLAGKPRELALSLDTPYRFALEKSLRRHVDYRTASALEFWRDLNTNA
jgi:serine/threonine protein kinase